MTPNVDPQPPIRWLLIPSFLFGPETWIDVARTFEERNFVASVANPRRPRHHFDSFVEPWVADVTGAVSTGPEAPIVVVGHSASCPRLPLVASRLLEMGVAVAGMVLVNGRFPAHNRAPVEEDVPMAMMLDGLIRPDGYLPPWFRWWGSLVEAMLPDEADRARVFPEAQCVPRSLFDEPIPAPELPADVGCGYLTMGEMYRPSHDHAVSEGWVVGEVDGEHLHMVVDPAGVADALEAIVAQFPKLVDRWANEPGD